MPSPIVIFDLDDTLVDIDHRAPLIEGENKQWDTFYKECINDTPIYETQRLYHHYRRLGWDVRIWTCRCASVFDLTIRSLTKMGVFDRHSHTPVSRPLLLQMRPVGDYRPSAIVKEEWLNALSSEEREYIMLAYDDNEKVVDMWARNSVMCLKVVKPKGAQA